MRSRESRFKANGIRGCCKGTLLVASRLDTYWGLLCLPTSGKQLEQTMACSLQVTSDVSLDDCLASFSGDSTGVSSIFSTFSIDLLGCLDVDMRLACFWNLHLLTTSNKSQPPIRHRSRQSVDVGTSRYLSIYLVLTAQGSPSDSTKQHLVIFAYLGTESFVLLNIQNRAPRRLSRAHTPTHGACDT